MAMHKAHIIAIGANLPGLDGVTARQTCEAALVRLGGLAWVRGMCRSRWYSSAAVPDASQPRYINGVVRVEGDISPAALLSALQAIEGGAGRVRGLPNAARTLDLDIIDMGGVVRAGPDPVLPHPRAHVRGFVLRPLRDVAPWWVHPVLRVGVGALIAGLGKEDMVAM
jgi:2-amino-4-hydroxy-6-hydroxymethyldihydropteridine diphosphokinase